MGGGQRGGASRRERGQGDLRMPPLLWVLWCPTSLFQLSRHLSVTGFWSCSPPHMQAHRVHAKQGAAAASLLQAEPVHGPSRPSPAAARHAAAAATASRVLLRVTCDVQWRRMDSAARQKDAGRSAQRAVQLVAPCSASPLPAAALVPAFLSLCCASLQRCSAQPLLAALQLFQHLNCNPLDART